MIDTQERPSQVGIISRWGRQLIMVSVATAIMTVAVVDFFGIDFVQPGDADNFSSHATAWIAVAIVSSIGALRPLWGRPTPPGKLLMAGRLLIVFAAFAIGVDAIVDVWLLEFILKRRVDNIVAAPAFFALLASTVGVVVELIAAAMRRRLK